MGKGTGLGLSTVYGIVRQNHGTIVVSSQPEKGSEFRIYLPRSHGTIDNRAPAESYLKKTGSETILLVEDDPSILKLGQDILQHLGYHVLTASSPGEAINTARAYERPIDLLITDIIMPEMNGIALAEKLQELRPGLPAIFMSGYYSHSHSGAPHPNQDRTFLAKPFSVKTLSQKIREILDSRAS
jgi:CheY-like chemotaxis protein